MIISRKKYEKLNDDLINAKAKVDDAKKTLDEENKIMRATLLIKQQRDQYKEENEKLREQIEEYRKRAENAMELAERANCEVLRLERENEKQLDLLQDFSKFINYKLIVSPASDTYKHYRRELDKLGVK